MFRYTHAHVRTHTLMNCEHITDVNIKIAHNFIWQWATDIFNEKKTREIYLAIIVAYPVTFWATYNNFKMSQTKGFIYIYIYI